MEYKKTAYKKTAFEILQSKLTIEDTSEFRLKHIPEILDAMLEFAKLHCEAALEAACKTSKLLVINTEEHREIEDGEDLLDEYECGSDVIHISASSILNAYPLDLIK